jgi:hypothetical protein
MRQRGLRILLALGVGAALVGLAAVLVRVSELTNFYKTCFWLGVIVLGLAVAALYSLAQSPTRVVRRPSGDPYVGEGLAPPVIGLSDTERRHAGWGSAYLALAALPCLLTAALHYWA